MDSLTQIVLGAAVGEAVLGKKVGNKALLYGAIAGTIPDLDVLVNWFTDTITAIEVHRGFSHSIVFCILMAPLLGWLANKVERKLNVGWKAWAKLFFWGLFTHPLLDAFTTWGTQLFWPFDLRLAFNSVFVIDPLYTLPFLICVILVLFKRRDSVIRRKINNFGIALSSGYLLLALILKWISYNKFEEALQTQGIDYTEISTRPAAFNTLLWNANIDTQNDYLIGDYSFFDTSPITFTKHPKNRSEATMMIQRPNVQRLVDISQGWFLLQKEDGQWYFNDLRFGLIPQKDGTGTFVFSYLLKEENGMITASEVEKSREDAQFLMKTLWERVKGK